MHRIRRGLRLAGLSWAVLREQPGMMLLPLAAALAQAVVAITYVLGVTGTDLAGESRGQVLVKFFPLYVLMTLIATYANAALVSVADARLQGLPATIGTGVRQATSVLPALVGWSVLAATVGVLLRALEERLPLAGRIAAAIAGIAWSLATVLAIPVLVLERRGPLDAVGRSAQLFRARWGETLVSDGACSAAVLLVAVPAAVLSLLVMSASPAAGIMLLAIVLGAAFAVAGALNGIVTTAAYRFAAFGLVGQGFSEADLSLPFRSRKGRWFRG